MAHGQAVGQIDAGSIAMTPAVSDVAATDDPTWPIMARHEESEVKVRVELAI